MGNQRSILSIAAIAIVIVVVVVLALLRVVGGSGSGTSLDPALKSTADHVLPSLNHPGGKLPVQDATLTSFQAWVYDVQARFAALTAHQSGARYEQLLLSDPSVMPPQAVTINEQTRAPIPVDSATIANAIKTGQGQYTTMHANPQDVRVYVVPLRIPSLLAPAGVTGVLEVVQRQT